jgi:hypothetical protein
VLGCPARHAADRLALVMLQQLLDPSRWDMEIVTEKMLTSELVTLMEKKVFPIICLAALPPDSYAGTIGQPAHPILLECHKMTDRATNWNRRIGAVSPAS